MFHEQFSVTGLEVNYIHDKQGKGRLSQSQDCSKEHVKEEDCSKEHVTKVKWSVEECWKIESSATDT